MKSCRFCNIIHLLSTRDVSRDSEEEVHFFNQSQRISNLRTNEPLFAQKSVISPTCFAALTEHIASDVTPGQHVCV